MSPCLLVDESSALLERSLTHATKRLTFTRALEFVYIDVSCAGNGDAGDDDNEESCSTSSTLVAASERVRLLVARAHVALDGAHADVDVEASRPSDPCRPPCSAQCRTRRVCDSCAVVWHRLVHISAFNTYWKYRWR